MKLRNTVSSESVATLTMTNGSSAMRRLMERRLDTASRHGPHQVPQKSRRRTFPLKSSELRKFPPRVTSSSSGISRLRARRGFLMKAFAISALGAFGSCCRYSLSRATPSPSRDSRSRVTARLKRTGLTFPSLSS